MTKHLTLNRRRPRQRALSAIGLLATFALGTGLGTLVYAHDTRLDTAVAALQQAATLVEASQTDPVSPQALHAFERHLGKAVDSIQDAIEHITAAAAAVDAEIPQ